MTFNFKLFDKKKNTDTAATAGGDANGAVVEKSNHMKETKHGSTFNEMDSSSNLDGAAPIVIDDGDDNAGAEQGQDDKGHGSILKIPDLTWYYWAEKMTGTYPKNVYKLLLVQHSWGLTFLFLFLQPPLSEKPLLISSAKR